MTSSVLKHQHTSLQFSDTPDQMRADVEKLFAKGKQFPIKTGTESGDDNALFELLAVNAKKHNHVLMRKQGNWVAVDKSIIAKGSKVVKDSVFVVSNDRIVGHMRDRAFPYITFTHADPRMGRISVAGFHYPTKGREKSDPNNDINKLYAGKIAEWMKRVAKGQNIAIGAGDFNMIDSLERQDWAFGGPFTSMADELGKHKDTGHGPIDGFVSFDKDGRVKAKKFEVLPDSKLQLNTDHFMCRGTWTVRHIKTK